MHILIGVAVVLAILFAPWLLVIVAGVWAVYSALVIVVGIATALVLIAYAGYLFIVVHPRQDRLAQKAQRARSARLQASDDNIAAVRATSAAAGAKNDGVRRQKKAAEDAIQAEVDEQIREAKIRKDLKARKT